MTFRDAVETTGKTIDAGGVIALVAGIGVATALAARDLRRRARAPRRAHHEVGDDPYRRYRQRLGRAILLGLELLVAADIIRTVAVTPTFESAGVLAIIVAIRTFLSISLEVELEGRWPWAAR